jgi:hypothetical protein
MASAIEFHPDFATDPPTAESAASDSGAAGASRRIAARELIAISISYLRGHPTLLWASATSLVAGAGLAVLLVSLTPGAPILVPF